MSNENKNFTQPQPSKHQASSTLDKQRLLLTLKEYLNDFKVWEADYAESVPGSLQLKIADYETAIHLTERAIRGELSDKAWLKELRPLIVSYEIPEIRAKIHKPRKRSKPKLDPIKSRLSQLQADLKGLLTKLQNPSGNENSEVTIFHKRFKDQINRLGQKWFQLKKTDNPTESELKALDWEIFGLNQVSSLIKRREIHQRNVVYLEAQLTSTQLPLTPEQLVTVLQPHLNREQAQITALEAKSSLEPHEQSILATHRQNLEIYQQMLAGERLYGSVYVINQINHQEQYIKEIDAQLNQLLG
jgi:hypothetical protein